MDHVKNNKQKIQQEPQEFVSGQVLISLKRGTPQTMLFPPLFVYVYTKDC